MLVKGADEYGGVHLFSLHILIVTKIWKMHGRWPKQTIRYAVNTGWLEIDIHGCYLQVNIAFVPIGAQITIDEYDVKMPVSGVPVASQIELWWRHNAKSEKTVFVENG